MNTVYDDKNNFLINKKELFIFLESWVKIVPTINLQINSYDNEIIDKKDIESAIINRLNNMIEWKDLKKIEFLFYNSDGSCPAIMQYDNNSELSKVLLEIMKRQDPK